MLRELLIELLDEHELEFLREVVATGTYSRLAAQAGAEELSAAIVSLIDGSGDDDGAELVVKAAFEEYGLHPASRQSSDPLERETFWCAWEQFVQLWEPGLVKEG